MIKLIFGFLLVLINGFAYSESEIKIVIPADAKSYIEHSYEIKKNTPFKNVMDQWSNEKWGVGRVRWSLGEYSTVSDINIDADITYDDNFDKSLHMLFSSLNNSDFVKKAGVVIYSCIFSNNIILIKAVNVNKSENGCD